MKPKDILDRVVQSLRSMDVHLSGDDSPLTDPWEEIKDQLQHELSYDWPAYLEAIRAEIRDQLSALSTAQLTELSTSLKCSEVPDMEGKLLLRLLARGRKEKVKYAPFDFTYFCYPLFDFTVYGQVIERTGLDTMRIRAFSVAAPTGEEGVINTNIIDELLTPEQFEQAQASGWTVVWRRQR